MFFVDFNNLPSSSNLWNLFKAVYNIREIYFLLNLKTEIKPHSIKARDNNFCKTKNGVKAKIIKNLKTQQRKILK